MERLLAEMRSNHERLQAKRQAENIPNETK
jgi:hypothetical protein